jgi:hypothetical protein
MRKTDYKNLIGDGKLPNLFWVSLSNDYSYSHKEKYKNGEMCCIDWIGDIIPTFKSKGKTFAKPFVFYVLAKAFCDGFQLGERADGFIVNRINIEDRLSGQVYEKTRIFNPTDCTVEEDEQEDVQWSIDREAELKAKTA